MSSARLNDLKQSRAEIDAQIDALENLKIEVKKLDDFTPEQKCAAFDKLYGLAKEWLDKRIDEGSVAVENYPQWFKEAVVNACFGKQIWHQLPND